MRRGGDEGQAAVELALVLPLVAVVLLGVVQVALVARDQVLVVHAAREAAREAAVDPSPESARRAAAAAVPLDAGRLDVEVAGPAGSARVVHLTVSYRAPTFVPFVGRLVPDVRLVARASMRREY